MPGVYLSFPFCAQKCTYCNFASGVFPRELEGRYHQVRRMFAALGNHVAALHRDRIGGLDLPDDLAPGQYRILDAAGTAAIFT